LETREIKDSVDHSVGGDRTDRMAWKDPWAREARRAVVEDQDHQDHQDLLSEMVEMELDQLDLLLVRTVRDRDRTLERSAWREQVEVKQYDQSMDPQDLLDLTDARDHEGLSVIGESLDHPAWLDKVASMDQEDRTDLQELQDLMASTETEDKLVNPENLASRARSDQPDSLVAMVNLATRE